MRNKPLQKRSNTRVNHIKETALRVFRMDPFRVDAGMIAAEAGITRTSMYRYFNSVSAIAEAILADRIADINADVSELLKDDLLTPLAVLRTFNKHLAPLPDVILISTEANPNSQDLNTTILELFCVITAQHNYGEEVTEDLFRTAVKMSIQFCPFVAHEYLMRFAK